VIDVVEPAYLFATPVALSALAHSLGGDVGGGVMAGGGGLASAAIAMVGLSLFGVTAAPLRSTDPNLIAMCHVVFGVDGSDFFAATGEVVADMSDALPAVGSPLLPVSGVPCRLFSPAFF
jgi:hypothetical protein